MIFLDNRVILDINKITKHHTGNPVFALVFEKQGTVIVTDASFLFEWRLDGVDTECPRFAKLIEAQKNPKAQAAVRALGTTPWREAIFKNDGKFIKAIEQEPTKEEIADMQQSRARRELRADFAVYTSVRGVKRYHYSPVMLDLVDLLIEDPHFFLYRTKDDAPIQMMAVHEGDAMVGVVANQL